MKEIRESLTLVRRERLAHERYVNQHFPKGQWLCEQRSRCSTCGDPKGMYTLWLRKPVGRSQDAILTEIIDGYCLVCGNDPIWYSLLGIESEREVQSGLPQRRHGELCSRCLSSDVIGIWRGLNPTGAECRHCGKIELPRPLMRVYRRSRAILRLKLMRLKAEERRLIALSLSWILKNPFARR